MTLQEAIREAQEKDIWFRPVCMKGTGRAYFIGSTWILQRSQFGAICASFPVVEAVLGEWETVNPHDVNKEYHALTETP